MKINSREALETGSQLIKEFGSWSAVEKNSRPNKHGVYVVQRDDKGKGRPLSQTQDTKAAKAK
jgi:hypothetical protein